jgi:myosin heavy subunit
MPRGVAMLAMVLAAAGCESSATKQKLAQLTTVSAEKDSLLVLMSENTRLLSEISGDLAKVKEVKRPMGAVVRSESPLASSVSYRDSLKAKISEVVDRVNAAESRLASSQRRIRNLGAMSDSMKTQLAAAEQAMTDLRATLENQKTTIASLETQVNELKGQNSQLTVQNAAISDTLKNQVTESNTVYYVVGTKDELKQKGIIQEQGSKFLFFGSKTLVPAWNLDPSAFTKTDRRQLAEISLPKNDAWYKIVSRQNLQYLGEPATKDGKVKGTVKITEPEHFWANSRYLIIVEG